MRKYALLFSGGINEEQNYLRYANDLSFTYEVLTNKMGFAEAEIEVLYAEGSDLNVSETVIKTEKANKKNFNKVITSLHDYLEPEDIFLLLVTNHGHESGSVCTNMEGSNKWISRGEVENLLNQLNCVKLIIMGQCYGGNYGESYDIDNAVIMSANKPDEASYPKIIQEENGYSLIEYDEFVCNFFSYFNGEYPTGEKLLAANGNKSVESAFSYAKQYDGWAGDSHLRKMYIQKYQLKESRIEEPCIKNNLTRIEDIKLLTFPS